MKVFFNLLSDVKEGKCFEIVKIKDDNKMLKKRLLQLGFIKGEKIIVLKKSLLKKTLLVQIQNYVLSIRDSVASMVEVK